MSNEFPELDPIRLSVDEETRRRHLASIEAALRRRERVARRRRALVLAAAALLAVPAMALASDDSVPGDLLYPVKRAVEPVVSIFDRDVVPERRVEEVEELMEREAPVDLIERYLDEARDVVTDQYPHLRDRLDRVVSDLAEETDRPKDLPTDRPPDLPAVPPTDRVSDTPATVVTTTTIPRDVPTTVTTTVTSTTHPPTDVTQPRDREG